MAKRIEDGLTNMERYKLRHPERVEASNREYRRRHPDRVRASLRAYHLSPKGGLVWRASRAKSRLRYPHKVIAHKTVSNAVRDGRLPHPNTITCACGIPAEQYHHPDYEKPLEVTALCRPCHQRITLSERSKP